MVFFRGRYLDLQTLYHHEIGLSVKLKKSAMLSEKDQHIWNT